MSKTRPILFSAPMVRAILAGAKTQTRRVCKGAVYEGRDWDPWPYLVGPDGERGAPMPCPYGQPGDRLWVRETWRPVMEGWASYVEYAAGGANLEGINRDLMALLKKIALRFSGAKKERNSEAWHPSIHMPRWASRITLEVVSVRVERLQDISEADAKAEGAVVEWKRRYVDGLGDCEGAVGVDGESYLTACGAFMALWKKINGAESWAANPWVWVVEFKVSRG